MKTKTLAILLLSMVLLAGGIATLGLANANGPEPDPVTVPVGRIGDEITYASFSREGGGWEPGPATTFRVEGLRTSVAPNGQPHEVVVVSHNGTASIATHAASGDGETVSDEPATTTYEHIDLYSRLVVRTEAKAPEADVAVSFPGIRLPTLDNLQFQGVTLTPGADVTELARVRDSIDLHHASVAFVDVETALGTFEGGWIAPMQAHIALGEVTAVSARVTHAGSVDGRSVLGIETRTTLAHSGDEFGEATVESVAVEYFAADVPYPVASETRITWHYEDGTSATWHGMTRLAAYEPGTGPSIGWPDAVPAPINTDPVDWERTDGLGSGGVPALVFPIDDALEALASAPTNLPYRLWRMQHPDAYLVSAWLGRGDQSTPQSPIDRWVFEFAAEDGTAYGAEVERRRTTGTVTVTTDLQASQADAHDADEIPADPVALYIAEETWRAAAGVEVGAAPADYFRWGFANDGFSLGPSCPLDTAGAPGGAGNERSVFSYVAIGRTNAGECLDPAGIQQNSILFFDVAEGAALWSFDLRRDLDRTLVPLAAPAPARIAADRTDGPTLPVIATGLIGAGTLLLVALVAYFAPALKYAATQVGVALPGFSRIEKAAVLEHPVRDALLTQIQTEPGLPAGELQTRVGVGWGTAVHHLTVLERNGFVSSLVEGRNRRFFPVGGIGWSERGQVAILKHPQTRLAYDVVLDAPGITTGALATRLGVTVAGAMWHVKRLEEAGLVERRKVGRTVHHHARAVDVARHAGGSLRAVP